MGKETDRVIRLLEGMSEKAAKRMVVNIHRQLVEETPKKTGWAANNWVPSVTLPVTKTAGSPENVSSAEMVGGLAEILSWNFKEGSAWVVNNVPYIRKLNEGSSIQAPAGFVDKIIQKEVAKARRAKL